MFATDFDAGSVHAAASWRAGPNLQHARCLTRFSRALALTERDDCVDNDPKCRLSRAHCNCSRLADGALRSAQYRQFDKTELASGLPSFMVHITNAAPERVARSAARIRSLLLAIENPSDPQALDVGKRPLLRALGCCAHCFCCAVVRAARDLQIQQLRAAELKQNLANPVTAIRSAGTPQQQLQQQQQQPADMSAHMGAAGQGGQMSTRRCAAPDQSHMSCELLGSQAIEE